MGLDCRYARLGPLLHATLRGTFVPVEAERAFRGVLDRCIADGASVLLLDCRWMVGAPTTLERFDFAKYAALEHLAAVDAGRTAPLHMVLLGRVPLIDPRRFGETVALNRGFRVNVTTEPEEAARWLGIDPAALASPGAGA